MSTWTKFEPKIVAVSSLLSPGNDASVWWISGSRAFGESHRELSSTPTVLRMSDIGRRTPLSISEESWLVPLIPHQCGWYEPSTSNFWSMRVDPTRAVRPTPCNLGLEESHYKTSDRLILSQLELPILNPTHFSRTGWGKRVLEPEELRLAFELPEDIAWNPELPQEILPLELFRAVVEVVLEVLIPPSSRMIKRAKFIPEESAVCEDRSWLPTLGK